MVKVEVGCREEGDCVRTFALFFFLGHFALYTSWRNSTSSPSFYTLWWESFCAYLPTITWERYRGDSGGRDAV